MDIVLVAVEVLQYEVWEVDVVLDVGAVKNQPRGG